MGGVDAAAAVRQVLGTTSDEDVLAYIAGCLEDEHFECVLARAGRQALPACWPSAARLPVGVACGPPPTAWPAWADPWRVRMPACEHEAELREQLRLLRTRVQRCLTAGSHAPKLEPAASPCCAAPCRWGEDAAEAFECFGEMLVGAGCVADEAAARDACRRLHAALTGAGDDGASEAGSSQAGGAGAGAGGQAGAGNFRALEGGPVLLDEMNRVTLHPGEIQKLGKNLIQVRRLECTAACWSSWFEAGSSLVRRDPCGLDGQAAAQHRGLLPAPPCPAGPV